MAKSQNTSRIAAKLTAKQRRALPAFHARLQAWYAMHGRSDLPWRNTHDPYAIYLSEVMLQQTQVKTVLERYYTPFLDRFPTLASLASAPLDALMKAWEGLGYYSRARNLQKAAQACGTRLPDSIDALLALPGIGRNTAHAIAAFAYHQPVAVMEANVKRVLCRLFALTHPEEKHLWALADALVDRHDPFTYNQAMMDIGAMVCTKRAADCAACPAALLCLGKDSPESYPAKKDKKAPPTRQRVIVAWKREDRYFLSAREGAFLHGLYGFSEYEIRPSKQLEFLGNIAQTYSHFTLMAEVYRGIAPASLHSKDNQFFALTEIEKLPLSRADSKVLALLHAATDSRNTRRKKT